MWYITLYCSALHCFVLHCIVVKTWWQCYLGHVSLNNDRMSNVSFQRIIQTTMEACTEIWSHHCQHKFTCWNLETSMHFLTPGLSCWCAVLLGNSLSLAYQKGTSKCWSKTRKHCCFKLLRGTVRMTTNNHRANDNYFPAAARSSSKGYCWKTTWMKTTQLQRQQRRIRN